MSIIFTIITLVFFPLNIILGAKALTSKLDPEQTFSVVQENQSEAETGVVQGAEKKQLEIFAERGALIPIRKDGSMDLALPATHASIILDADTGTILHYHQGKEKLPIASLTKIMTAVLVMEKVKDLENEVVTVGKEAVYAAGTKIGCPRSGYCVGTRLQVGEKIAALNLFKAMLANSANDAAIALAVHIAGSEEKFVDLMNAKAESLGLKDTNFCTSSGLEIDGQEEKCYSTAYDIARIAAHSLQYELIWKAFNLPTGTEITSSDGKIIHQLINTVTNTQTIPGCLGAKTGFTPAAGHCLLAAASNSNGHKIVAVVLNDPYRWQDIRKMIDWVFSSYEWK